MLVRSDRAVYGVGEEAKFEIQATAPGKAVSVDWINNGQLIDQVRAAGQRTGERCWPLPLWDDYREQIDSTIADMKNSGGRAAGSITAGWFLKEFVDDETPWVHLDIAGTAYRDEAAPYLRKGATGVPARSVKFGLSRMWSIRLRSESDFNPDGEAKPSKCLASSIGS